MASLPTLFVSHGSAMHALHAGRAWVAWAELARRMPRPRAVLIASAHWDTDLPRVSLAQSPPTIHDFGGFAPELYQIQYPAPGAPELGQRALELLRAAGLPANGDADRGLDHGAWVPLRQMFPAADVPVFQVSVQSGLDAAHHLRLGRALAPLAAEGVLIVGSGYATHNVHEWIPYAAQHGFIPTDTTPLPYVDEFRRWLRDVLRAGDEATLTDWPGRAPYARRAHPSPDHFLPLPFAYGAAGPRPRVEWIDAGVDAGVLALDAYVFTPE